jgi:alpha-galactosidase
VIEARYAEADLTAASLDHKNWWEARPVEIARYWSGTEAPAGRHAEARILWSEQALLVRFLCHQTEPLVTSSTPQTEKKTIGLWDRDVCEIFVAPDPNVPDRYFEFEAAPTGEWVDLAIQITPDKRELDWEFHSGMTAGARVEKDRVIVAMRIPWNGSIRKPQHGDRWGVNLFRCVGSGETRGYLAWQPTCTAQPNFHVPKAFGSLLFA